MEFLSKRITHACSNATRKKAGASRISVCLTGGEDLRVGRGRILAWAYLGYTDRDARDDVISRIPSEVSESILLDAAQHMKNKGAGATCQNALH